MNPNESRDESWSTDQMRYTCSIFNELRIVLAASEKLELRGHNRAAARGFKKTRNLQKQQVKEVSTCMERARRILPCSDGLIDVCLLSFTWPQK